MLVLTPFLITNLKDRIRFGIYLPVAFFTCAFPVLFRFPQFKNWIKNLFLHSGRYGSGEEDVVKSDVFLQGLSDIFSLEPWLWVTLMVLVIGGMRHLMHKSNESPLLLGLSLTLLAGILMVAKHFEYRYLFPVLLLMPVWVVLTLEAVRNWRPSFTWLKVSLVAWLVIGLLTLRALPHRIGYASILKQDRMQVEMNVAFIRHLPASKYWVLASQGYGAPIPQYALAYSVAWAGPEGEEYQKILGKYFPYTWQYFTWDKRLRYWGKLPGNGHAPARGEAIYIYLERHSPELMEEVMATVFPERSSGEYFLQLLYQNPTTGESISRLTWGVSNLPEGVSNLLFGFHGF
jgi:hypothetical protein